VLSVSSLEDGGRPGSSGRPLGSRGVSNSTLEVLRDERRGAKSSKEGTASVGVVAGEGASESGSSATEAVQIGNNDSSFSGGVISISHATDIGTSCTVYCHCSLER